MQAFTQGETSDAHYSKRMSNILIPRDIMKEIAEKAPNCFLIIERYSVERRSFAGSGADGKFTDTTA